MKLLKQLLKRCYVCKYSVALLGSVIVLGLIGGTLLLIGMSPTTVEALLIVACVLFFLKIDAITVYVGKRLGGTTQ